MIRAHSSVRREILGRLTFASQNDVVYVLYKLNVCNVKTQIPLSFLHDFLPDMLLAFSCRKPVGNYNGRATSDFSSFHPFVYRRSDLLAQADRLGPKVGGHLALRATFVR